MTRTRKLTLSVKEFSHLVSESLDIANAASTSQSFVDNAAVLSEAPQKSHPTPSHFQRIFSRPTPEPREDSPERTSEDRSEVPRKMIAWPFSRSPRKNHPAGDEDNTTDPDVYRLVSPYSVTSVAATSTSSLGSLLPADERLFQVTSQDSDGPSQRCNLFRVATSFSSTAPPSCASEPPTDSALVTSDELFGNGSATSGLVSGGNCNVVKPTSSISNQSQTSVKGTGPSRSDSVVVGESESIDSDPTPRASTFGSRAACPPAETRDDPVLARRKRSQHLSLVVPSQDIGVLILRPAVGVAPHVPSETESLASVCSTSPPTSPVARSSSPALPTRRQSDSGTPSPNVPLSTPPNPLVRQDIAAPSNVKSVPALGCSPRQRKQVMSRSMTPPPLPRPPPTGPLPAVPSSVPPVPPLPPLLHKISMNVTPQSIVSSPRRSIIAGAPANPPSALPPSPPGGLRLPSRLSWVSSVRAALPSPPASPTKSLKSLTGKISLPSSPSKAEKQRPRELKRPTSISVIEAADNNQVRRTKSILLLGSRSKSNVSLGTKRVQIDTDVNLDAGESRKPRPKSTVATAGHPICSSDFGMITPMPSSELLVPRERRHSAPMLSSVHSKTPGVSADWTLSLPFCTDVPGSKILLSPLSTPRLEPERGLEEVQGEDWTLCMPLKVRVNTPTGEINEEVTEGRDSVCTLTENSEGAEVQTAVQLPTPSPSPTRPTPSSIDPPLEPEESTTTAVDRPASPASLGPHVGGLDFAGGCGKRASGWHVYGWFDEVSVPEDECQVASTPVAVPDSKLAKGHIAAFKKMYDASGRQPSQDSTSTTSTSETTFYSARSSWLTNP